MSQSFVLVPILTLLLIVSVAEGIVPRLPPYVGLPSQDGLARLFFGSRVTRSDPQISVNCFAGYIAESNAIGESYSQGYANCLDKAQQGRVGIDKDFLPTRQRIESYATDICSSMTKCNKFSDTLDSFNCHATVGSNNTVAMYSISGNATDASSLLHERYRLIDLQHNQCNQNAERLYVASTADNYNYLQACLDGRVKPKPLPTTTSTSSTTTTTTTTTTTEAPTTTPSPVVTETTENLEDQFKQLLNMLN